MQQLADDLDRHALGRLHQAAAAAAGHSLYTLRLRLGRIRCRVISIRPNGLVRRIFVRARSRFTASRSVRSTLRRCRSLRMSMKSLTTTPPRSRSRSCRAISLGRDQIELIGRFLGRVVGAEVAAVDVDRHQGLGLIDHERAAALERHLAAG